MEPRTAWLAAVALAALAACGGAEPAYQPPRDELRSRKGTPADLGAGDAAFDGYLEAVALSARSNRGGLRSLLPPGPLIDGWLAAQPADREVTVEVVARARLTAGPVASLMLRSGPIARLAVMLLRPVSGEHTTWLTVGAVADDVVSAGEVSGDVFIDPGGGWMHADLAIELARAPEGLFVIDAVPQARLEIKPLALEITQDGRPCRTTRLADLIVVEPAGAGARFRVRYDGVPVSDHQTDVDGSSMAPRGFWTGVRAATWMRIAIHHPRGTIVRSSVPAQPRVGRYAGWRTTELIGASRSIPLWVVPDAPRGRTSGAVAGGTIELEAAPEALAQWWPIIERAADALAPLGPYPRGTVPMIVLPGFGLSEQNDGAVAITVGPAASDREKLRVVTHELAHLWFGGHVGVRSDVAMRWWEAVAEYCATWAFDEEEALRHRADLLARLATLPPTFESPAAPITSMVASVNDILSYHRGALVLIALEARVGRPAMVRWLRLLAERRAGLPTGMADVLATVEEAFGAPQARWLRAWIETTQPATVRLEGTMLHEGRLLGDLIAEVPTPTDLQVRVAFTDREGHRRSEATIELAGPRTPIDLPVPDGATHVVLDSDAVVPLRAWPASSAGTLSGFVYLLPGSRGLAPFLAP